MVSISACHADDPGSIPGRGVIPINARKKGPHLICGGKGLTVAVIAQLGERQTEDLEVLGSIPSPGIIVFSTRAFLDWSNASCVIACGLMV